MYRQLSYVNYKPPYKYTTQVGVILKREYPGLVEDKDEDGSVIGDPRPALDWGDYFLSTPNELGVTSGDRVLSEFWVSNMCFASKLYCNSTPLLP